VLSSFLNRGTGHTQVPTAHREDQKHTCWSKAPHQSQVVKDLARNSCRDQEVLEREGNPSSRNGEPEYEEIDPGAFVKVFIFGIGRLHLLLHLSFAKCCGICRLDRLVLSFRLLDPLCWVLDVRQIRMEYTKLFNKK
jgi:hypothetical protein